MPLHRESETVCLRRPRRAPDPRWGALVALGLLGCTGEYEPERPLLHYSLASDTQRLADDGLPVVPLKEQAHIQGSLEMLFGTPASPQYLLLGEWIDDGFDPNYPQYAADDMGSGEFTEEDLEAFAAQNEQAFARQLELIAAGRYDEVRVPDHALDLAEYWHDELLPRWQASREAARGDGQGENALADQGVEPAQGFDAQAFQEEAAAAFRGWYPTLRESAEFYRVQCLHCHGPEGGGNGPTAKFLDPLPRDYRRGVFKFTSQKDRAMPSRHDLHQILARGVTGTAMPSFRRFSDVELHGLVDYVRLLAMRGMVERDLAVTYEIDEALPAEYVLEAYQGAFDKWFEDHGDKVVAFDGEVPPPTPESIARGKRLFEDAARGNCASCHGVDGRGQGPAVFVTDPETGAMRVDKKDDWGHDILPRNITQGLFRGGRRPIDIYRRIYAGINGTPMPAIGESKDPEGHPLLSGEDLWALVHYVGHLSEQGPQPAHRAAPAAGHGDGPEHADEHATQHEEGR
jgi:mono/diheme cytochrome c family protein